MSIGFEFRQNELNPNILKILFNGFDFEKYQWYIYNEQAWDIDNNDLFNTDTYTGIQFKELLKKQPSLVMLMTIYGYNGEFTNIGTFNEYCKSDCQCAVYITDAAYIDIYCKKAEDYKILLNNARKLDISELLYIDENNLSRYKF